MNDRSRPAALTAADRVSMIASMPRYPLHFGSACLGKIRHKTRAAAIAAWRRTGPRPGMVASVYHCRYCGFFHWGNARRDRKPWR
jgi:hypothetical protein